MWTSQLALRTSARTHQAVHLEGPAQGSRAGPAVLAHSVAQAGLVGPADPADLADPEELSRVRCARTAACVSALRGCLASSSLRCCVDAYLRVVLADPVPS